MSRISVSLRIIGEDDSENMAEVVRMLERTPYRLFKKGRRWPWGDVQTRNVLVLDLARWEERYMSSEEADRLEKEEHVSLAEEQSWHQVLTMLEPVASALRDLDRTRYQPSLYISTIRDHFMGGFSLSPEIVAIASKANLPIDISILVDIEDEASPETEETESSE